MKPSLLLGLAFLSLNAFAAQPAASPPPATPAPGAKADANKPADAKPTEPAAPANVMDAYTVELVARVQLTDDEKKQVEDIYKDDGVALHNILNNDSLSPLQKAQQVADLRDARNQKIETLLHDLDRDKAYREVENMYRVALTEYAADGGLVPPPPPAPETPAPAPAPAQNAAPGQKGAPPAPPKTDAPPAYGSQPAQGGAAPASPTAPAANRPAPPQ